MKTTIDLPDTLFRKAKATAAKEGVSLKSFITEAVKTRLAGPAVGGKPDPKPWMRILNALPAVSDGVIDEVNRRVAEADAADLAGRGKASR